MITIGMNYEIKDEFKEKFIQACKEVINNMNNVRGHLKTNFYNDINNPNSFLIYSEWETKEYFTNFMRSDSFRNVQDMGREMLLSKPIHRIYNND